MIRHIRIAFMSLLSAWILAFCSAQPVAAQPAKSASGNFVDCGQVATDVSLMVRALNEDPHLDTIEGYAADSGEGRWTVNAAVDLGVPVPTMAAALFARFTSQQEDSPSMKMVAAMRNQFGGHAMKADDGK